MSGPQTADAESVKSELLKQVLDLCEGDTVQFSLEEEPGPLPDYYSDGMVLKVTRTKVKHQKRGLEAFYVVDLNRPGAGLRDDPLFRVKVARDVPHARTASVPEDPMWESAWVGHKSYDKFGNYNPSGHHDLAEISVVDAAPCCSECGRVVQQ